MSDESVNFGGFMHVSTKSEVARQRQTNQLHPEQFDLLKVDTHRFGAGRA